ncbi:MULTISPECIES: hypothetical protein [unclassified Corallococcus]|uniref:hypothetical protein n=1 Tax=unclassified Corallococcus TaxID=2685029 RepID=UPI001A90C2D7|nr:MULTISPECIES: hypothetical protein [unclassified Corallococcus]MBN9684348.1 hypothetical protein [Corallococcus sp. NCSPR001]WAS84174.1 hypothetical protein O0N60_33395 [Corallococcus sp. NCRR]
MDFELLLSHANDRRPVLEEALPLDAASHQPRPEAPREEAGRASSEDVLLRPDRDPNSLPDQRWGVVVPEGPLGDRLLALIAPLCALRAEEQGAPVRVYRVPPGMDGIQAVRWMDSVLRDEDASETEQPAFLLMLGDFDQVSFELQQMLGAGGFTGRLTFGSDAGYEAYVDKVLRWSRTPAPEQRARTLLFTAHDGTPATTVGYQALMAPSFRSLRTRQEEGLLRAEVPCELGEPGAWSLGELLGQVASPHPSMLFTLSHGLGAPRRGWASVGEQRARQGAMSLGGQGTLEASDLASTAFLPGGFWFYFACFSAGTPSRSAYHAWLSRLREAGEYPGRLERLLESLPREGERPFVAALPQAALANPQGPLAVMGHVDLAWTYSFQDMTCLARDRPSRFMGLLSSLVEGSRAGVGLSALLRSFNLANMELTTLYDQEEFARRSGRDSAVNPVDLAHLWMLRHDLAGYILLGDPAVRLPLAGSVTTMSLARPETLPPGRDLAGAGGMADAVIRLLAGTEYEGDVARRAGVPVEDLLRWKRVYMEAGMKALADQFPPPPK